MAQCEQTIEGVFAIELVVSPGPVKAPLPRPERVEEVENGVTMCLPGGSHRIEGMERNRGGQQIRQRRPDGSEKPAGRMESGQQPVDGGLGDGTTETVKQDDCGGGGGGGTKYLVGLVSPASVGGLQGLERLNNGIRGSRREGKPQVCVSVDNQEAAIDRALG